MRENLFQGELVRLTSEDPETQAKVSVRWSRDSEYLRLLDSSPERMWSARKIQSWIEKAQAEPAPGEIFFSIRKLTDDRLIGFVGLDAVDWVNGDALAVIGIGERDCWGKGYGTDAMRLLLQFSFMELNLERVSLNVFSYNPRAIRSYEKAGFQHEGRQRELLQRAGERADLVWMGILRAEWLQRQGGSGG